MRFLANSTLSHSKLVPTVTKVKSRLHVKEKGAGRVKDDDPSPSAERNFQEKV